MNTYKYPENITLTKADFEKSDYLSVLESTIDKGYFAMSTALSFATREAMGSDNLRLGKVYWLLADACCMTIDPGSRNEPFKLRPNFYNRRSIVDGDFSENDMYFFEMIAADVEDYRLKARLADLVWLRQDHRDIQFALMAIDAYRQIPLDSDIWVRGGRECWQRAITLTLLLKSSAGNRLQEMENSIFEVLSSATSADIYRVFRMADLLSKYKLGASHQLVIAEKLKLLSQEFDEGKDYNKARDYAEASARWYGSLGEKDKSIKMVIALAEGWAKEAVARVEADKSSSMVAAGFYENAIQVYRTIPKAQREVFAVDQRIAELHKLMSDAGEKAIGEMKVTSTPGVNISDLMEAARVSVSNKPITEALNAFVNLSPFESFSESEDKAIKQINDFPFSAIFSSTHVSQDGRVIAKTPGTGFARELTHEDSDVWSRMVQDYGMLIGIIVQGWINPALAILSIEHRLREIDFLGMVQQSPIVPPGRKRIFAKALFSGYDGDFITAIHILIPQIEHMVRFHLKNSGGKTTTLNSNGIETENGLSTLVELPEMKAVFGEDLSFEIKALFCDAIGPNLRNQLAHGLLDDRACNSTHGAYAWWLGLKIVFNTFWNAARRTAEPPQPTAEAVKKERKPHV